MDVEADVEILDQAELAESAQSLLQQMNADSESSASQENVGWKCKLYDWDVDTPAGWRDAGTGFLFVDLRLETAREVQEQHGSQQYRGKMIISKDIGRVGGFTDYIREFLILPSAESILVWEDINGVDFALSLERASDAQALKRTLDGDTQFETLGHDPLTNHPFGQVGSDAEKAAAAEYRRLLEQNEEQNAAGTDGRGSSPPSPGGVLGGPRAGPLRGGFGVSPFGTPGKGGGPPARILPPEVSLENLEEISKCLDQTSTNFWQMSMAGKGKGMQMGKADLSPLLQGQQIGPRLRLQVAAEIRGGTWMKSLKRVFEDCEDLENEWGLDHLFRIAKNMFLLNNRDLFEMVLSKEHYEATLGMLEYDKTVKERLPHRKILAKKTTYRKVINFQSDEMLETIRFNFRCLYIKDVCMARYLDDMNTNLLLFLIHLNTQRVVEYIITHPYVLDQIVDDLEKRDWQMLDFICDALRHVRYQPHFQQIEREKLFNALTHRDLLGHLLPFLLDPFVPALPVPTHEDDGSDDAKSALCERPPHPSTRTVALEIIHLYTFHNPSTVRWHIIHKVDWIRQVVSVFFNEMEMPTQAMLAEILKWLFDFEAQHNPPLMMMLRQEHSGVPAVSPTEQNQYLEIMWDTTEGVMNQLLEGVKSEDSFSDEMQQNRRDALYFAQQCILDVFSGGVTRSVIVLDGNGGSKRELPAVNYWLIKNDVMAKAAKLLKNDDPGAKFVHISAIRLVRTVLGKNNVSLIRCALAGKDKVFGPMFELLMKCLGERATPTLSDRAAAGGEDAEMKVKVPHSRTGGNAVCSSILAVVKQTIDQTGAVQAGENWLQRILAFWVDNYPFLFELPHCDRDRNVIRLGPRRTVEQQDPLEVEVLSKTYWMRQAALEEEERAKRRRSSMGSQRSRSRGLSNSEGGVEEGSGAGSSRGGKMIVDDPHGRGSYPVADSWFDHDSDSEGDDEAVNGPDGGGIGMMDDEEDRFVLGGGAASSGGGMMNMGVAGGPLVVGDAGASSSRESGSGDSGSDGSSGSKGSGGKVGSGTPPDLNLAKMLGAALASSANNPPQQQSGGGPAAPSGGSQPPNKPSLKRSNSNSSSGSSGGRSSRSNSGENLFRAESPPASPPGSTRAADASTELGGGGEIIFPGSSGGGGPQGSSGAGSPMSVSPGSPMIIEPPVGSPRSHMQDNQKTENGVPSMPPLSAEGGGTDEGGGKGGAAASSIQTHNIAIGGSSSSSSSPVLPGSSSSPRSANRRGSFPGLSPLPLPTNGKSPEQEAGAPPGSSSANNSKANPILRSASQDSLLKSTEQSQNAMSNFHAQLSGMLGSKSFAGAAAPSPTTKPPPAAPPPRSLFNVLAKTNSTNRATKKRPLAGPDERLDDDDDDDVKHARKKRTGSGHYDIPGGGSSGGVDGSSAARSSPVVGPQLPAGMAAMEDQQPFGPALPGDQQPFGPALPPNGPGDAIGAGEDFKGSIFDDDDSDLEVEEEEERDEKRAVAVQTKRQKVGE